MNPRELATQAAVEAVNVRFLTTHHRPVEIRGTAVTITRPVSDYWVLRAELAAAKRSGEIAAAWNFQRATVDGQAVVQVEVDRLRQPRPAWVFKAAATTTAMATLIGAGVMLYQARWVLLCIAAALAVVILVGIKVLSAGTGGGGCSIVHGPGCGCSA